MLVISRKVGTWMEVDVPCRIKVIGVKGKWVRLGFEMDNGNVTFIDAPIEDAERETDGQPTTEEVEVVAKKPA